MVKQMLRIVFCVSCLCLAAACYAWVEGAVITQVEVTPTAMVLGYPNDCEVTVTVNGTPYGANGGEIWVKALDLQNNVPTSAGCIEIGINPDVSDTYTVTANIYWKNGGSDSADSGPINVYEVEFNTAEYTSTWDAGQGEYSDAYYTHVYAPAQPTTGLVKHPACTGMQWGGDSENGFCMSGSATPPSTYDVNPQMYLQIDDIDQNPKASCTLHCREE